MSSHKLHMHRSYSTEKSVAAAVMCGVVVGWDCDCEDAMSDSAVFYHVAMG